MKTAVVGTGFMGRVHLEALRRVEFVDVLAVVGRELGPATKLGAGYGVPQAYDNFSLLLEDEAIDAVHICTPNATHFSMAREALLAGKHVLCEKPLSVTSQEASELAVLARERGLRNCVCHNLRYYPMVQQMRQMVLAGELGDVLVVQGTYSQDWLLYETDWNWRIDAKAGGPSRAMADIGSHWFDMAEHITGLRVAELCADLQTFFPTRKRPRMKTETFGGKLLAEAEFDAVPVETEDFGTVIFRLGERARGSMTASQVSAGRKNRLSIEVYGTKSSAAWDQERPDELWMGRRNEPNQLIVKDPSLLRAGAQGFADLPGGHSEGYDDTFKQVFRRFYASILDLSIPEAEIDYPQMADGLRQMLILEGELESSRNHGWVKL